MKIGVIGAGGFADWFVPLFQAHPLVEEVYLAEKIPERLSKLVKKHNIRVSFTNKEDMLKSDADAVAIFTQRWTHGPQAIAALRAGKHVYSAVPAAISIEELQTLIGVVEETGLLYMMGETSYYYPSTIYCRNKFKDGAMGRFVYAEAGYYHDMEHGFYLPFEGSNGAEWRRFASFPTHALSFPLGGNGTRRYRCTNDSDFLLRLRRRSQRRHLR